MASPLTDEQRTNEVGLFNYAHTYWASASALQSARVDATHPDSPIIYLYFHAIELFLKSYLRARGRSVAQIKRLGHSPTKLSADAEKLGLQLEEMDRDVIELIGPNYMASRYIEVGYFSRPTHEALWATCSWLFDTVGQELLNLQRTKRLPQRPMYPSDAGAEAHRVVARDQ